MIYHPDVSADPGMAHRVFPLIYEAYSILSDESLRSDYDASLSQAQRSTPHAQSEHKPFNQRSASPTNSARWAKSANFGKFRRRTDLDIHAPLEIDLETAILGGPYTIHLSSYSGIHKIHTTTDIPIHLPKCMYSGQVITVPYRGDSDSRSGERGHLLLTVQYAKHSKFRLSGCDIYSSIEIMPWDWMVGGTLQVSTLEGSVQVAVPDGHQPWRRCVVENAGMPDKSGTRGKLILHMRLTLPKTCTAAQQKAWHQLRAAYQV